jgi:hypothetical protein
LASADFSDDESGREESMPGVGWSAHMWRITAILLTLMGAAFRNVRGRGASI